MLAFMTAAHMPIAIEPDFIESVQACPDYPEDRCVLRTASGKEHTIQRSYKYVTGVIQSVMEAREL
jgi:hypothetical protein